MFVIAYFNLQSHNSQFFYKMLIFLLQLQTVTILEIGVAQLVDHFTISSHDGRCVTGNHFFWVAISTDVLVVQSGY